MKVDRVTKVSIAIVLFFFGLALLAPFLASRYPLAVFANDTEYEIAFSPVLSSFARSNRANLNRIPFRELAAAGKITALFSPIPYGPYEKNLDEILASPGSGRFGHYLGTDDVGRDVASRMIHGAKNSMMVGLVAVGISLIFGVIIGSLAGYFGGWTDLLLSRLIEIVITFPTLILIMAVLALLRPSLVNIMVIIGLTGWTGTARIIRGEFFKRKNQEYVQAAMALGASHFRVIVRHILPGSLPPVLVMASFGVAGAVLMESSLSFLGIGIRAPEPSWGQILNSSRNYIDFAWWMVTFPGMAIFFTVVSYNLLGDYLRKALSPRERTK